MVIVADGFEVEQEATEPDICNRDVEGRAAGSRLYTCAVCRLSWQLFLIDFLKPFLFGCSVKTHQFLMSNPFFLKKAVQYECLDSTKSQKLQFSGL